MSSVSIPQQSASPGRPQTIAWATWITAAAAILGLGFFFLPGSEDIPAGAVVIGIVATVLTLAGCWWLWKCKRWAAVLVTAIMVLNLLTSLPGLLDPPSNAIAAALVVNIPVTLLPIWLMWHPASRKAYR